jgi:hypothetical protein
MSVVVKVHPGRTSTSVIDLYKPDAAQPMLNENRCKLKEVAFIPWVDRMKLLSLSPYLLSLGC